MATYMRAQDTHAEAAKQVGTAHKIYVCTAMCFFKSRRYREGEKYATTDMNEYVGSPFVLESEYIPPAVVTEENIQKAMSEIPITDLFIPTF